MTDVLFSEGWRKGLSLFLFVPLSLSLCLSLLFSSLPPSLLLFPLSFSFIHSLSLPLYSLQISRTKPSLSLYRNSFPPSFSVSYFPSIFSSISSSHFPFSTWYPLRLFILQSLQEKNHFFRKGVSSFFFFLFPLY